MLTLVAAAVLAPGQVAAAPRQLHLIRSYKEGEVQAYSLEVTADAEGAQMKIDAEIVFKVRKVTSEGAEIAMNARKFKMSMGGHEAPENPPHELIAPFDKLGMPHAMSTENEAWVYMLTSLAGLVPGKETGVGDGFGIDWKSKDNFLSTTGKGKAVEVVELDGVKAVKLDYDLEVKPGTESPGMIKATTYVRQEDANPISTEGTVKVEQMEIRFKVKRLKA